MNEEELVGQIIDIFEDNLHNRAIIYGKKAIVPLVSLDEDSSGVFFAGDEYDLVASQLKTLLKEWRLI